MWSISTAMFVIAPIYFHAGNGYIFTNINTKALNKDNPDNVHFVILNPEAREVYSDRNAT
jgi:hypothetical protein